MELWQLKYFLAVAEELNFGLAGERLHVAQPTVTRAIQSLESELGVALLLRDKRNVELTHAGRVFLEEARAILAKAESSVRLVRRAASGEIGTLNIGFEGSSALSFVPVAAGLFHQRYPDIRINFFEMPTSAQIVELKKCALDAGILVLPINDAELDVRFVSREPLWVAMSPAHRLATQERIAPEDMAEERILGLSARSACGINLKIADVLGHHVVDPIVHISDTYLRTEFVRAGLGISIVPASVARTMGDQVTFRPLWPAAYLDIAVAASRHNPPDPVTQHFFDAMRQASDFTDGVPDDR